MIISGNSNDKLNDIYAKLNLIQSNTEVSKENDIYNTTEIQNIKNSITGISTNVQATTGRDRYYYMLVKPTVADGSWAFKDMPTILDITNSGDNVEMMVLPCTYNTDDTSWAYFIDGILEDDIAQIFANVRSTNNSYLKSVKNMNDLFINSIVINDNYYGCFSYYNDDVFSNSAYMVLHEHSIQNSIINDFKTSLKSLTVSETPFCTSKYFKRLRLKALYYGSFLVLFKTKNKFTTVGTENRNSVVETLDGTTNFQQDSSDSAEFTHYNTIDGVDIYAQSRAIVIPPTLI